MMQKRDMHRRAAVSLIAAATTVASARRISAQNLDKVSFQTNWRAQAEHGGYYFAVANGLYRKHGVECDLRAGGPQRNPSELLLGGRVDMVMSNGLEAINYAKENAPFMAIAAIFQRDPQCLMSHPNVGHDRLENLRGKPILIDERSRSTFWPFLRARFGFSDAQLRPYTFSLTPFLADTNVSQQAFVSSEPFVAQSAGVTPVIHMLADHGFENYQNTIHISRRMAAEKKDVVQRFVNASLEGWAEYIKGGPAIDSANALIKRDNPAMTDELLAFALAKMQQHLLVKSGDALTLGVGAMTDERWKRFCEAMADVGVAPKGVDVSKAYSLEFVNKGVGA